MNINESLIERQELSEAASSSKEPQPCKASSNGVDEEITESLNIDLIVPEAADKQEEAEVTMISEGYEDDRNIEPLLLGQDDSVA